MNDGEGTPVRTGLELAQHWDDQAAEWTSWATAIAHDSYWRFHGREYHGLMPEPGPIGARALDLASGEGRVARRLAADGWTVDAMDMGAMLCANARSSGLARVVRCSANAIPVPSGIYDLVSVFMGLHDFDETVFPGSLDEIVRVLKAGGSLVIAVQHPTNSFLDSQRQAGGGIQFTVGRSYFDPVTYETIAERDGLRVVFRGVQRPLQAYINGLLERGLLLERMVEVRAPERAPQLRPGSEDWAQIPMFVDLRFSKVDPAV